MRFDKFFHTIKEQLINKSFLIVAVPFIFAIFDLNAVPFISNLRELERYYKDEKAVMIASNGRSGSTLLTNVIDKHRTGYKVLKTHLLPPQKEKFKGKIIFIYSNPDLSAESALHLTIQNAKFGKVHFDHVESSDIEWLKKIGNTTDQTLEENLLSYDALGCLRQLNEWVVNLPESDKNSAQVLAIKYENLWDAETVQAIKEFLKIKEFKLPPRKERGYPIDQLHSKELEFRLYYNLGTFNAPQYAAYDEPRAIWEESPAVQYFDLQY